MYMSVGGGYTIAHKPKYDKASTDYTTSTGTDTIASVIKGTGTPATNLKEKMDKSPQGPLGFVALGYNLSDVLRSELNVSYSRLKEKEKVANTDLDMHNKLESWRFVANLYYHFNNDAKVSPYVFAGAGVKLNKARVHYPSGIAITEDSSKAVNAVTAQEVKIKGKTKTVLTGNIGLGAAFAINDNVSLDLQYTLSHLGKGEIGKDLYMVSSSGGNYKVSHASKENTKDNLSHSISLGVRFQM